MLLHKKLWSAGINFNFVIDYESFNKDAGTLRGIHAQKIPHAQTKLIRVTAGSIIDFVVDLRKDSSTYMKWLSFEISDSNKKQILVPKGFGHAFVTLLQNTSVLYKFDDYYSPNCSGTIRWDDPELNIDWGGTDFIMSKKDRNAPFLKDCGIDFTMEDL